MYTNESYLIERLQEAQLVTKAALEDVNHKKKSQESIIEALTPSQMIKVASGNTLMCRFRFDEEMIWSLLADHGRRGEREDGNASRLHASILMAGKFSEAV